MIRTIRQSRTSGERFYVECEDGAFRMSGPLSQADRSDLADGVVPDHVDAEMCYASVDEIRTLKIVAEVTE